MINNENDVTTFPPNEMEAATKQTPEVVFFFQINLLEMATPHFPKWKLELVAKHFQLLETNESAANEEGIEPSDDMRSDDEGTEEVNADYEDNCSAVKLDKSTEGKQENGASSDADATEKDTSDDESHKSGGDDDSVPSRTSFGITSENSQLVYLGREVSWKGSESC